MTPQISYEEFLKNKIVKAPNAGLEVSPDELSPILFPHQRDIVLWALRGGRRALFQAFGTGKTIEQLELLRVIHAKKGGKCMIIAPLGVRQEFKRDAVDLLGMEIEYVRNREESLNSDCDIQITNYERFRDGNLDPSDYVAVTLDEASVLRSFGSKTYQTFLEMFSMVPYRFVCTATPSPNKYKELIHYAGFLGIMDTGQALTRFFQRDSTQSNNLTIYPHMEKEFWYWMGTWAVFLSKPSDLGYSDEGYDLPEIEVIEHMVGVDHNEAGVDSWGQYRLLKESAMGLKEAAREKKDSLPDRIAKAKEIIESEPSDKHWILWHDLEAERHEIKRQIPQAVSVYGSQDLEDREDKIIGFSNGAFRILSTKPVIAGSGCNFQRHCSDAIFVGIGFKFNDFIQAIHRIHRFKQTKLVRIHIIFAESEQNIRKILFQKWSRYKELVSKMGDIIQQHGLTRINMESELKRSIGVDRREIKRPLFTVVNNDCVAESMQMESDSIDQIITSIPFSNKYEYTPSYNCFGHNPGNDEFFQQMDYLTPELFRILKPGRMYCCHVKDWPMPGSKTGKGMYTIDPIHMYTTMHTIKHGFEYCGMITVTTDVVRENNQTYRLGWTEQCKDGTKMGVGAPEYILLFRKPPTDQTRAYADEPVTKEKEQYTRAQWQIDAHAFWRSNGNRFYKPEEVAQMPPENIQYLFRAFTRDTVYDYGDHVELGKKLEAKGHLPATYMMFQPGAWNDDHVWDDVNRMITLNSSQNKKGQQMHICPLQFDIVDRLIDRFSNPGDMILDPFGGLMTVPYRAVMKGRKGYGVELNYGYFLDGLGYMKAVESKVTAPTLFEMEKI